MSSSLQQREESSTYRSCFRNDLLQGQVALVTGGGSGSTCADDDDDSKRSDIGYAIAVELASLGATVVIAGRDAAKCQAAVAAMATCQNNNKLKIIAGPSTNIRDADQVAALVAFTLQHGGRLDIVVNCAGGQFISPAEALSKRGFAAVVETNLVGTFLVSREAYTQYMQEHGGSIVNITLVNANGLPGMSHSAAARAGVENLTKSLATEWMEAGVRVNCVRPGIIWTESGFAAYGDAGEEFLQKLLPAIPAKRLGTPEEVSSAVVWLLSPGANYVTGTTVSVDGGAGLTLLPMMDIPNHYHLPVYGGKLPTKARL
eukprot:scaffold5787_cov157-Amphora_coffeaeformis.AAC.15